MRVFFKVKCGVFTDVECAKSYAKIAESAKTLASQQVSKDVSTAS